ncbi:hypothetical protein BC939DRAFT_51565 [Gamsiella multidivaricata]|uniref:uncharacterized protein n=1 Tax=Gamsiella multidivaricata TaxID=101098 RepID=UPI002220758D|nr:uncharacterized protein BC939DRAFT_51565 [Gamsiella multidivaricata]KAI7828837.1 hypothetical protein BC939DRAFT_51565 [Gamsiella multidivaricata]
MYKCKCECATWLIPTDEIGFIATVTSSTPWGPTPPIIILPLLLLLLIAISISIISISISISTAPHPPSLSIAARPAQTASPLQTMTVEVPSLQEAHLTSTSSKDTSAASPTPDAESTPTSPAANAAFLNAVERFKGLRKRTLSPNHSDISDQQPFTSASQQQHHDHQDHQHQQWQQQQQQSHSDDEDHPHGSDNIFDFDFKAFGAKFKNYRKSLDYRNPSLSPSADPSAPTDALSGDDERHRQLKAVIRKMLFRRKKDKRGKSAEQTVLEAEDYQLWKNVAPLLFQPSAVFMGLSFMIEDKGSALEDRSNVDWNMNIILALVKC